MFKRILSFILSFVVVFFISIDCTPSANAVANPAFLYSALYTYLLSAGYQFSASGGSSDVSDMMESLYGEYVQDGGPALSSYSDYISLSTFGQYVFGYPIIQDLQDFASWIKSKFSMVDNASDFTTVYSSGSFDGGYYLDDTSFLSEFANGKCSLPVYSSSVITAYNSSSNPTRKTEYHADNGSIIYGIFNSTQSRFEVGFASSSGNAVMKQVVFFKNSQGEWESNDTYTNTSSYSKTYDSNLGTLTVYSGSYYDRYGQYVDAGAFNLVQNSSITSLIASDLGFVLLYGNTVSANSLAMRIAQTVIDRASQVSSDQSLVVDMGLAAGTSAADAASTIFQGISAGTISQAVPVTSVVADVVIDTPVQDYPDFADLGLPELGLALVERFPFCIPYDFVKLVQLFNAEPVAPYIVIDIIPQSLKDKIHLTANTAFTLDFTSGTYASMGIILRWGSLIGFCVGLLFFTRKLIWSS